MLFFFLVVSWQDEGKAPDLYVELDFKEVYISNFYTYIV